MRVTFFSNFRDPCGIADYSRNLLAELTELVDLKIVAAPAWAGQGVPYLRGARAWHELGAQLNDGDLCHIQHEYSFWGGYRPLRNLFPYFQAAIRVPVVMTAHEVPEPPYRMAHFPAWPGRGLTLLLAPFVRPYADYVNRKLFDWPERVIVHAGAQKNALVRRGVAAGRVAVIPHGIPALPEGTDCAAFVARFGLTGKRIVSLLGFISPRKGYELVLQVLPQLPPEVTFVVAGGSRTPEDAAYEQALRATVERAGLGGRVVVTGYLAPDELPALIGATEVVVAPFQSVSGSGTLSLALAGGAAILAADLPPLVELNTETGALLLFRAGDVADFLDKLRTLLGERTLAGRLAEAGREYARRHSFREVAEATVALYREVLRERAATVGGKGPSPS